MFSFFSSLFSLELLGKDNSHKEKFFLWKFSGDCLQYTLESWNKVKPSNGEIYIVWVLLKGVRGFSWLKERIENNMNEYSMNVIFSLNVR